MSRRGFTLAEMLLSLVMMSAVLAMCTHAIVGQLRFFTGIAAVVRLRSQLAQAGGVVRSALWSAAPLDITAALDSAIELQATIGGAVVCGGDTGNIRIPVPAAPAGNALSAFVQAPDSGDRAVLLFDDSLGTTWLGTRIAAAPRTGASCPGWPDAGSAWTLPLAEPILVPAGAVVRVLRPLRFSLYRAADSRWYLGGRDWNSAAGRFNGIQPVAGPLRAYSADPATSGLVLVYRDAAGAVLAPPVDASLVASVTIVVRGETTNPVLGTGLSPTPAGAYADSLALTVALRNR